MPALVNSSVGSLAGTSEDECTRRCPFSSKNFRNISRIWLPERTCILSSLQFAVRLCFGDPPASVPLRDAPSSIFMAFLRDSGDNDSLGSIMHLRLKAIAALSVFWIPITTVRAQEIRNIPSFTAKPDGGSPASPAPGFFRRLAKYYHD